MANKKQKSGTVISLTPPDNKAAACPMDRLDRLILGAMSIGQQSDNKGQNSKSVKKS